MAQFSQLENNRLAETFIEVNLLNMKYRISDIVYNQEMNSFAIEMDHSKIKKIQIG